jgi:hypothetical protein
MESYVEYIMGRLRWTCDPLEFEVMRDECRRLPQHLFPNTFREVVTEYVVRFNGCTLGRYATRQEAITSCTGIMSTVSNHPIIEEVRR